MIRSDEHHPRAAVVANAPDGVIAATVGPRLLELPGLLRAELERLAAGAPAPASP